MTGPSRLRRKRQFDSADHERLGPILAIVREMIEARRAAGLTQTQVASRMGTSQPVIARLENAHHMPTFELLARYAAATGYKLDVHLVPGAGEPAAAKALQ